MKTNNYILKQLPIGEIISINGYKYILSRDPLKPNDWYVDHEKFSFINVKTCINTLTGKTFNPYNPVEFCNNDQGLCDYINKPGKEFISRKIEFTDNPDLLLTGVKPINT